MLFTSIYFWATFILFLSFFVLIRRHTKLGMMLYVTIFSLAFYALSAKWLMLLLPAVATFSWAASRWMRVLKGHMRKEMLALIVIVDLTPLLFFKYGTSVADLWNMIMASNFSFGAIVMPVGISFFTFQIISYVVDVYHERFTDKVSLLEFMFYATFFPLIFAGPITRAETFFSHFRQSDEEEPGRLRDVSGKLLYYGMWLIMLGLVKKLVVADYIAQFNNWVFDDPMSYSGFENLMAAIGYSIQIFCDFSGYSDLSIGMAALMGIRLPDNFNYPYQSLNITEFWHRWHISLSTWFRDYCYIPLGGNRKGKIRTYANNFLTMLVAGMWHGSTWMFTLWGAVHGLGLIVHKANKRWLDNISDNWMTKPVSWLLTYLFVLLTWMIFRSADLGTFWQMVCQISTTDFSYLVPFVTARPLWMLLVFGSLLVHATRRKAHHDMIRWYTISPFVVKVMLFALVIQMCIQMHTSSVQPFIYFQF